MKKRYYNETTKEWYTEGNSLTRRVNGVLFSGVPSVEQLTAWGFVEWVEPAPTPEELINIAKSNKLSEIEVYDTSSNVNEFFLNGVSMWLDDATRSKLEKRFNTDERDGLTITKVTYENVSYSLPIAIARGMLYSLESYARDCFDKTNEHKLNVLNLQTVQEIENYDYTTGYPTKCNFTYEGNSELA